MISIAYLIPTLERHGAEKQLTLLATHLPREEFHIRVIVLTRTGSYESVLRENDIPVTILKKRGKAAPVAFWRLRRLIADWHPDILHTWLFAANAYGRLAVGRHPQPNVIVSERCVDQWKRGWHFWLDRKLISRTAQWVGNSQSVAEFYRKQSFPAERISVIPNAIDVEAYGAASIDAAEKESLLAKLDLPANAKVVGYIGRIAKQKRVEDLVWATELLQQLDERVVFIVVGDGPEQEHIQRFVRQIRLESRVRFLGHRNDVSRLLACFDVFWLASSFEGQSNSLMEAMAAGVPVVVSDIPANRELVTDGETGFVVNVGDRPAFARLTQRLLSDPALAERIGSAARERMRSQFSLTRMVDAYASLYRDTCAEAGKNA